MYLLQITKIKIVKNVLGFLVLTSTYLLLIFFEKLRKKAYTAL